MDQDNNKQLIWVFPNGPRLLKCPFRVVCKVASGDLLPNTYHMVDEVVSEPDELLLFVIKGQTHSYKHFAVIYISPSTYTCVTPDFPRPE